jgi:eukaryotic-like serine/threonine-protein kinase
MARSGAGSRLDGEGDTRPRDASGRQITHRLLDDRYRLEALIGAGGAGQVYRAHDMQLGETVAVKVLRSATPGRVELLREEVRLARRVTHPNVVRVHDLGVAPGDVVYLTMEFVPGTSLGQLQRRERLGTRAAAQLGKQMCDGLHAAHRAGVLHVDLKPANVLVRDDGGARRALVSDFGVARALGASEPGPIVGTPGYMAPEQRRGEPLDARTDIFSAALVLYELFAGENLFASLTQAEKVAVPEALVRSRVPEPVAEILIRALDPDPAGRPGSAALLAGALADLAGESTDEAPGHAPRLAVVPFRDLGGVGGAGGAGDEDLGIGVAEELIRVLSTIPAVKVFAGGATANETGDPRAIGARLGADAVVRGAIQRGGERVRMNVALVDVKSGLHLWGDLFEGAIGDVLGFQERTALRICESLRVRWISLARTRDAPAEAIELYLRARRELRRQPVSTPEGPVAMLERCLALAPDLEPAIALRALACCKAWLLPSAARQRDWAEESRAAVAIALARAPELAESHFAAGFAAAQRGDIAASVRSLRRALELAPTAADVHDYLGRLLAEVGRVDEALEHLTLSESLDPTLYGGFWLVRYHALRGDRSGCAELESGRGVGDLGARQLLLRIATWYGDREELRRHAASLPRELLPREAAFLLIFVHYILGGIEPAAIDALFASNVQPLGLSPRVMSGLHQMMVEAHASRGEAERALAHLTRAAESALIDLDWLGHCPLLEPLRVTDAFAAAESRTRRRAEPLWND